MYYLLALFAGQVAALSGIQCQGTPTPLSNESGPVLYVTLKNTDRVAYDVCLFDSKGVERFNSPLTTSGSFFEAKPGLFFTIREQVPYIKCKGKVVAGPLSFTASATWTVAQLRSQCLAPFNNRRVLAGGWNNPLKYVATTGTKTAGETVQWSAVKAARGNLARGAGYKPFMNHEKLFDTGKQLYEIKVANSKGLDTTRVIFSFDKGKPVLKGIVAHIKGLSNKFERLLGVAEEVGAATSSMTEAGLVQATASQVTQAIAMGANAAEVGATVAEAGEFTVAASTLMAEFIESLAILLFL